MDSCKSPLKTGTARAIMAAAFLALAGCTGDLRTDYEIAVDRTRSYVAAHPELPAGIAADITRFRARTGMTMEQVIAAWGRPAVVKKFRGGAQQQWFFGCGWPHHCSDADDDLFPTADEIFSSQVIFENGVAVDVRS